MSQILITYLTRLDVYMPRRTTLVLDDSTYLRLVEESLRRYGTPRAISRVIDTMVEESARTSSSEREQSILKLLYSKKIAKTSSKEFEKDRRELSQRFEKKRTK